MQQTLSRPQTKATLVPFVSREEVLEEMQGTKCLDPSSIIALEVIEVYDDDVRLNELEGITNVQNCTRRTPYKQDPHI